MNRTQSQEVISYFARVDIPVEEFVELLKVDVPSWEAGNVKMEKEFISSGSDTHDVYRFTWEWTR